MADVMTDKQQTTTEQEELTTPEPAEQTTPANPDEQQDDDQTSGEDEQSETEKSDQPNETDDQGAEKDGGAAPTEGRDIDQGIVLATIANAESPLTTDALASHLYLPVSSIELVLDELEDNGDIERCGPMCRQWRLKTTQ